MKEMVGGCCVCSDERGWPDNPLVYCDGNGCTVAVHQACYGIVTVPTGPWFCRKCESPENKGRVRCELCPSRSGALKRTDTGGWAHVVCALYIPEVRFGNVTSMEPIVLRLIPPERYSKSCYICQGQLKPHRASAGACMQCNKSGCKQQFHVTCAQSLGLLCEEAGNYLDNVKYCGYCQHHYSKLKKGGNVKTIPPYNPTEDSNSSDSNCGKEEADTSKSTDTVTGQNIKTKGPGIKSSQSSTKNAPVPNKVAGNTMQVIEKKSPLSHRLLTSESGSSSKINTPVPSPQHSVEPSPPKDRLTPSIVSKISSVPVSPNTSKPQEAVSVINSVATNIVTSGAPASSIASTSQMQSVITNIDAMETKHTKKRKAAAAAAAAAAVASAAAAVEYEAYPPNIPTSTPSVPPANVPPTDINTHGDTQEQSENMVKKVKMESTEVTGGMAHPSSTQPALPPPAHCSGLNTPRSPRCNPTHIQNSTSSPSQQHTIIESMHSGQLDHGNSQRTTWGGLNVSYEMQQDNKSVPKSQTAKVGKPIAPPKIPMPTIPTIPSSTIRNKKRVAMGASVPGAPSPNPPPPLPLSMRPETSSKDVDTKPASAPHMLGNELNPESGAAARLQEQLSAELVAHASGAAGPDHLVPPPLINKALPSAGRFTSSAQSLDQLLERQWEQGSQFLMEQAQHFDIASLLSCLHQLRTENVRLEEHVSNLLQRRDHLLAVNARLAIPLATANDTDNNNM